MTGTLNPEALRTYRRRRGYTSQDQLAAESKISKTQISRWERGKQVDNIRQSSRDRLCKALGVDWKDLTRAPKREDILKRLNRLPLKCGIDGSARTFLTVVRWHLGLTEEAVLDLAPLAVLILAAQSLHARQAALDDTLEALGAVTEEARRRMPYMPGAFHGGYDYDPIEEERKSLAERELFMTHEDDEGNEYSPFINFIEDQLKTLGLFENDPIEFTSLYRGATPDYAVPMGVLSHVVGLGPDNEADQKILARIQDGQIDLQKAVEKKKTAGAEELHSWLEEQYQAVTEVLASQFKLPPDLLFELGLPGDQSSMAAKSSFADQAPKANNTEREERT